MACHFPRDICDRNGKGSGSRGGGARTGEGEGGWQERMRMGGAGWAEGRGEEGIKGAAKAGEGGGERETWGNKGEVKFGFCETLTQVM